MPKTRERLTYVSIAEAAQIAGCHPSTVWRALKAGRLDGHQSRTGYGCPWRILVYSLERWMGLEKGKLKVYRN